MAIEENVFGNLPTDLIIEIFSRLPFKSIARFGCLSKQWVSLLTPDSAYFTELFLTQSKTRPRLLFAVWLNNDSNWLIYSCPYPQISSISVTLDFHMRLPNAMKFEMSPLVSGLLYFPTVPNLNNPTLCNPTTRQLFSLPQLTKLVPNFFGYDPITKVVRSFFGYDPIDKQFKVLAVNHSFSHDGSLSSYQILKLGFERLSWRNIECPLGHHYPLEANICINGILYYIANFGGEYPCKIASFDFNSEEFKFIDVPSAREPKSLVNFKGKLGAIDMEWVEFVEERYNFKLSLWVLEDVEKQEWCNLYRLSSSLWNTECPCISIDGLTATGLTATGEVVLSLCLTRKPLYIYFLNLEKNILRKVEIKGLKEFKFHCCLVANVNYVENLRDLNWN